MNKKVAIIGCGWLGLPLAKNFIKSGYTVNGSTTSKEKLTILNGTGINPFLISLSEDKIIGDISGFLEDMSTVVINVPPKLRSGAKENYVKKMQLLHTAITGSGVQKVIFTSSTSVYGDIEGEVTEETKPQPSTESGRQLLLSEEIFQTDNELQTTIIRFGGLIGAERHPINMLSGRKELSNGNHPINLIHLDDCVQIIQSIIKHEWWNEIFNGVFPYHPKKIDYYTLKAEEKGLPLPLYRSNSSQKGKVVGANKLILGKKYSFSKAI